MSGASAYQPPAPPMPASGPLPLIGQGVPPGMPGGPGGPPMPGPGAMPPGAGPAGAVPPGMDPAEFDALLNAEAVRAPDGTLQLLAPDRTQDVAILPEAHAVNLAEPGEDGQPPVPEAALSLIGELVCEGVEADLESNQEFYDAIEKGIALLGLKVERLTEPFDGASGAVHPMLLRALVAFVAMANGEMLPAAGPVRTEIAGDATPEAQQRADRQKDWLNYYLTAVDEDYYPDCDQGWLICGLMGSIYRKVFRDPITGQPRSRFLTPLNLIVSYNAVGLAGSGRVTQVDALNRAEVKRRQLAGYYREIPLGEPTGESDAQRRVARQQERRFPSSLPNDAEHLIYSSHVLLDVADLGVADLFATEGPDGVISEVPDGLPLPFIVTVDHDSRRVLRLEPDWRKGDPLYRARDHYAHYRFMPGLGIHGWGLLTLMAASTDTASVLLRQALNAFTFASFPGGLRAKGTGGGEQTNITVGPGEWPEIETNGLPIGNVLMPLPYKDVPPSFAPILAGVVEQGEAVGQINALQVGEGRQDAPVGTTIALIEQAMRPTAATIRRMHTAQRKEFRLLAQMFAEDKGAKYPYIVGGRPGQALASDFADVTAILPVSDPNIPTQVQRLSRAEAVLKLSQAPGSPLNSRLAYEKMLRTVGLPDQEIEALMAPGIPPAQPADIVTEFASVLHGMPLAVGPAQAHAAHLAAHLGQMQIPNLPPNVMQALLAHCADHLAALYAATASRFVGQAVIPGQPMPPEVDAAIAVAVAQNVSAITEAIAPAMGGAGGQEAMLGLKRDELKFKAADSARKATETARQDQTELIKQKMEMDDAAAERRVKQTDGVLRLLTAVISANKHGPQGAGGPRDAGVVEG